MKWGWARSNSKAAIVSLYWLVRVQGTDYLSRRDKSWKREHPHERITAQLKAASAKPYSDLLSEHVKEIQSPTACSLELLAEIQGEVHGRKATPSVFLGAGAIMRKQIMPASVAV